MRLSQFLDENGRRALVVTARGESRLVRGARNTLDLAGRAIEAGLSLRRLIADLGIGKPVDLARALKEKRVLPPIDGKDPAHLMVSGACLTHLGPPEGRDARLRDRAETSDATRLLNLGVEGGKPARGAPGAQPAWVYRGDGAILAAPEGDLLNPAFALAGEAVPEIVGVYVIDPEGQPVRIGFALANGFRDPATESENALWLAHSRLRPVSLGPELLVGDLPAEVAGVFRIRRGREIVWETAFQSGEQAMAHSLANLEAHHFKYAPFRRPGDAHVHFFGAATLSSAEGVEARKGDVFEIESELFGLPLRNRLWSAKAGKPKVRAL